jgi:hypothetical protein
MFFANCLEDIADIWMSGEDESGAGWFLKYECLHYY